MKKRMLTRAIALLLTVIMLAIPLSSCANEEAVENETVASTEEAVEQYPYFPDSVNFDGKEYHILNCLRDQWLTISYVTSHEYNGDAINDDVYRRTLWLEETLNCKLVETNVEMEEVMTYFDNDVSSGANEYALFYLQMGGVYTSMTTRVISGQVKSLSEVETVHLDEEYYYQYLTKAMSLGGVNYSAASDAQLSSVEGTGVVLFDVEMLKNSNIDMPYDYVRNGTWTLETMANMAIQATDLKSDGTFDWDRQGECVYGISVESHSTSILLTGADALFGRKDSDDFLYLDCENTLFFDKAMDIAGMYSSEGVINMCTGNDGNEREAVMLNRRSAFHIQGLHMIRSTVRAGLDFGVVPAPKYDEDQENYQCSANFNANYPCISISYAYPEEAGLILDALSFEAHRTFEKVYYEDHLELRNNSGEMIDDIEMLRLIRKSITADPLHISGVAPKLLNAVRGSIENGGSQLASSIAQNKEAPTKLLISMKALFKK